MKFSKAVLVNISESDLDQKYWQQIDELVESRIFIKRDDPNLTAELKDADCLMLGFQVPTDKDIFDAAPNLKLVSILATAYGTVNLDIAKQRGIPVCNLAGYSTEAVAEFTIAILLHQIRQFEEGLARGKAGNYDFAGLSARELKNSQFGVVGLGNIGNRVAELAAGFGANVSYWSRSKKDVPFTYKELNKLLAESDYISVNVAQTPDTEGLFNAETLALVKPGTVIINTVPPEIFDTDALAVRLAKDDIAYVSDHADEMSPENLAKLKDLKNCLLLPAIAFITQEARVNKQEIFVGNLKAVLEGKPQNNQAN
ncbi:MAG TPA: 2-hydroxyacid dehydrogenase [Candidatus Saccharimonadales bacterium]|nr:2-hydroxyacid dehydrogenase [Candidatus Saccharimonadales bacterium]